jgi:hypothetical protein
MKSPVEILFAVNQEAGHIEPAGDKLRVFLPADCPPELKEVIRQHKAALLDLLRLNFVVVRSDTLNTTVFWTPDESTKEALVNKGVHRGDIYTASELEQLVNRRVTDKELPLIHAAKKCFDGKLKEP